MTVAKRRRKRDNGDESVSRRKEKLLGNASEVNYEDFDKLELAERVALIQDLIPLGLMAVAQELNREVEELVGARYSREDGSEDHPKRYGYNDGTVRLGGRIVPVKVPRVRTKDGEVKLKSYEALHANPELDSQSILRKVVSGVSIRDVDRILPESSGSIGTSRSSISRHVVSATKEKLREFETRTLSDFPVVSIFIDGTSFSDTQMIIALGVGINGCKRVLGFVEASAENSKPVANLLRDCIGRGLSYPHGVLVVIDGSKGLRKAVRDIIGSRAVIQRCQWHKRENILSYLAKPDQSFMKKAIQRAYDQPIYNEARAMLKELSVQLSTINVSAHKSLEEGLEETLSLHKLDMAGLFGPTMRTTNCIESLNSRVKAHCSNVKRWKNSAHKQRWLATAILEAEQGFRRIQGYKELPRLCSALEKNLKICPKQTE